MRKLLAYIFLVFVAAYIIGCGSGGSLSEEVDKDSEVKIKDMQKYFNWVSRIPKPSSIDEWGEKFSTSFEGKKLRWRGVVVRESKKFYYMKAEDLIVEFESAKPIEVDATIEVLGTISGFRSGGEGWEIFLESAEWIAVE